MNTIQEAIIKVAGLEPVVEQNENLQTEVGELMQRVEHVDSTNALLQRQIEDIDYLNLFDLGNITEVIPLADRKKVINRLRRLRQENPLAKQSVQLIKRFTLGKGIQVVVGPDPEKKKEMMKSAAKEPGVVPAAKPFSKDDLNAEEEPVPYEPPEDEFNPDDPEADPADDELKRIVSAFWKDPDNQLAFTSRQSMNTFLDEIVTDGEKFLVCVSGNADPYVKLTEIPLEEVEQIIYNPDNWKQPAYYKRNWQPLKFNGEQGIYEHDGEVQTKYYLDYRITAEQLAKIKERVKIPAGKLADEKERIYHCFINPLWTKKGKRGISELYASREWFRVYKEFMEDRAAINAAATSVAYKRKIKGGPTEVARFANKLGGISVGYESAELSSDISKLTRPIAGATYDSNPAVDLEWMKTDTGAVNAKEDGRGLAAAAGAGMGIFQHYYGDGGDANLATAQAMELPMVKTFEDWQQWTDDTIISLIFYAIEVATDRENAVKWIERVGCSFPAIISQDVVKFTTAWSQMVRDIAPNNKIVAREAIKSGLVLMQVPNVDALMTEVEAEQVRAEAERKLQQQQQLDALKNSFGEGPATDGKGLSARNGSSAGLDPNLKKIASGSGPIPRNGPKPPA